METGNGSGGLAQLDAALAGVGAATAEHASGAAAAIDAFIAEIGSGAIEPSEDLEAVLAARIADLDDLLAAQVNAIIHHRDVQRLEAAWRGLHYLVSVAEPDPLLRIRVLHASRDDLRRDYEGAMDVDLTELFKKVYTEQYDMLGGEPFGILVGDYEFANHPQDVDLLQHVAQVAAAAHAPFLAAASPAMFGWESFSELATPRDLPALFAGPEFIRWRAFRARADSRYVGLTLPGVLLRAPYRSEDVSDSFWFEEEITHPDTRCYLFGNAAFALAACIVRAFTSFHWCAAIRGWEGGRVEDLPCPSFDTDREGVAVRGPTQVDLTDERERDLAELGFVPLVRAKGRGTAVFYSVQSCQAPQAYTDPVASANARLSSQLQYLLVASRFAHYLKVMMRDRVGTYSEPRECERMLQDWILQYCLPNPEDVSLAQKASRPLREALVQLEENKSKPGAYDAVVYLKPHFQLEGLNVQVEMRTELQPAAGVG